MNSLATGFPLVSAVMLFLSRRWAPLPLLVGACYMPFDLGLEIGAVHLPMIRIMVVTGIVRVMMRGGEDVERSERLGRVNVGLVWVGIDQQRISQGSVGSIQVWAWPCWKFLRHLFPSSYFMSVF